MCSRIMKATMNAGDRCIPAEQCTRVNPRLDAKDDDGEYGDDGRSFVEVPSLLLGTSVPLMNEKISSS